MYRKILVTVDGSALARSAVKQASTLAGGTDAEVIVLQVVEPMDTLVREAEGQFELTDGDAARIQGLAKEMDFAQRDRARAETERAKAELAQAGVASVRAEVLDGLAGNEIVNLGSREQCDAIVMATRGHGGLGREVVGSVAEYVLRHAGPMAVVLVGPRS